jgi:hypothetical protein
MTIKSAIILKDEPNQSSDMIEISSIFHWRKLVVVDRSSHEKKERTDEPGLAPGSPPRRPGPKSRPLA